MATNPPRNGTTATRPAQPKSPDAATALFERKLRLVAEQLSCRDLFAELEGLDTDIEVRSRERNDIEAQLAAAQAAIAELEALVALQVEGKNETERKANKVALLKVDEGYQAALRTVRELEAKRLELDTDLHALGRKARRVERRIDYNTGAMRFLGG